MSYARLYLAAQKRNQKIEEILSLRPKEVEAREKKYLEKPERSRNKEYEKAKDLGWKTYYIKISILQELI